MGEKVPDKLVGRVEKTFAYDSLRLRVPEIITRIIDGVHRGWPEFDKEAKKESSDIINRLAAIKYDLEHNRALVPVSDGAPDCHLWNEILANETALLDGKAPAYFDTAWLYSECFIYRKIAEAFAFSPSFKFYDWFGKQKRKAYEESLEASCLLASSVCEMASEAPSQKMFCKLLKICLWGNKCDLSLSGGSPSSQDKDPFEQLNSLDENILRNDAEDIWDLLTKNTEDTFHLDVILDNSGYELVTDLLFCFYVMKLFCYTKVVLHCKQYPWFVSDAVNHDVHWTLYQMSNSGNESLAQVSKCLTQHLYETNRLRIIADTFWTLPCSIDAMKTYDKLLYRELSNSNLVVFKGDLNYRKISQDREFDPTQSFNPGFHVPICAIRTLKADTVFGLPAEKVAFAEGLDKKWRVTANFGVIHFILPS